MASLSGPYLATTAGGLESVLESELKSTSSATHLNTIDSTFPGGVVFTSTAPPQVLQELRACDSIYAFLHHQEGIPLDKEKGLQFFEELPDKLNWSTALELVRLWKAASAHAEAEIRFRVSANRTTTLLQKHGYRSPEIEATLGGHIQEKFGWPADMEHYNVEILAWVEDDRLTLAAALLYSSVERATPALPPEARTITAADDDKSEAATGSRKKAKVEGKKTQLQARHHTQARQLYGRRPYRKALVLTSLRPSTAYALLQLADVQPGHIVLDPLCGCGTIPLEAASWKPGELAALGGELDPEAAEAAGQNSRAVGRPADVVRWNACYLPMRQGLVDRVVSDLPFGVRCGNVKSRGALFPRVLREIARVLVPDTGRAVLLCVGKKIYGDLRSLSHLLHVENTLKVSMEGLKADVILLRRTREAYTVKSSSTRPS